MGRLDDVDLTLALSREEEQQRLEAGGRRLLALRLTLGGLIGRREPGPPVCILFEGWDAAGKGGTIKRLVSPLDPRHVRVVQFGAPTGEERRRHWLWRFWPPLPGWGDLTVMDRSWYGRVLAERVEHLATREQWQRGYREIDELERTLAAEGTVLVKFFLHISDEEQLRRFEARERDPLKHWKLTEADWRNRKLRPEYERALEDMFDRTDTEIAPWHVVPAESKRYARVHVVETVCERIEAALRRHGIEPPPEARGRRG